jgi:hypothetical protein
MLSSRQCMTGGRFAAFIRCGDLSVVDQPDQGRKTGQCHGWHTVEQRGGGRPISCRHRQEAFQWAAAGPQPTIRCFTGRAYDDVAAAVFGATVHSLHKRKSAAEEGEYSHACVPSVNSQRLHWC